MTPTAPPRPIILDTDIGSDVDDTWAVAMLLRCPELDPKLMLTTTADVVYRARVTAKLLEVAGRTDVPIGLGIRGGPGAEFQRPWIEDYPLERYPGLVHDDGIDAMIRLILSSPEPVTVISIAPTGNIAEALRRAPEIAGRAHFVGMQGSVDIGYGDTGPDAETNVRLDVESCRAVFDAPWRSKRITPLDTCGDVVVAGEAYQTFRRSAQHDALNAAVMENYAIWKDLVSWMTVDFFAERSSVLFDCVAVYMAYADDFLEYEDIKLRITDDGMTVRDPKGPHEVSVAIRWRDRAGFDAHLLERLLPSA